MLGFSMSTILGPARFPRKPAAGRSLITAAMLSGSVAAEPLLIRIESGRIAEPLADQPAAVSVVERPAGRPAAPDADLGDLLAGVPGVFASARANAAQDLRLSIRGFGARGNFGIRGVRLLVDGFPATLPDGQATVDDVDPALIERIEVRRGPAASLYGAAAGGVVSLSTRPALGVEPGGRLALGAGSHAAWSAHLRQDRRSGSWNLQGDLSGRGQSGYREHSAQQHRYLHLRLARRTPAGGRFEARLAALDSPFAQDPGGLTATERDRDRRAAGALNRRFDTGEAVEQQRLALSFRRPWAERGEIKLSGYLLRRDFSNRLPFSATALERNAGGVSLQLERSGAPLELGWGAIPWRWLAGLDLDQQRDDRRRFDNDAGRVGAPTAAQDERVTALGAFAQLRFEPGSAGLRLGLRADRIGFRLDDRFLADGDQSGDRVFRRLSPSAGVTWRASERANLYARISRAFETPTTTELADPSGAGGFNPALGPQTARALEAGLRWRLDEDLRGELALFDTRVEDQLVPRPIAGQPDRFFYVNAASSYYRGIEASLEAAPAEGWRLTASGEWARYRFDRYRDAAGNVFDGLRVPGIPEYQFGLRLDYRPAAHTEVALELRRVGSRAVDDANSARAAAYTRVDLRAQRALPGSRGRVRAAFGIDNLFAAEYADNVRINAEGGRFYEPAAGRSLHLSVVADL